MLLSLHGHYSVLNPKGSPLATPVDIRHPQKHIQLSSSLTCRNVSAHVRAAQFPSGSRPLSITRDSRGHVLCCIYRPGVSVWQPPEDSLTHVSILVLVKKASTVLFRDMVEHLSVYTEICSVNMELPLQIPAAHCKRSLTRGKCVKGRSLQCYILIEKWIHVKM